MKIKKFREFVGDFETTVFEGQEFTEVWASALVELFTDDVLIFHSIDETFEHIFSLAKTDNIMISYHNLKFDGSFILDYLLRILELKQATIKTGKGEYDLQFIEDSKMQNNTFKYSISDMGQWYNIIIKKNNHIIEIRDSLKLLPFSVKKIGKSFETKHKKLDIEYEGFRYAGCTITDEEKEYIKNDVLVVKEALELMKTEGHTKLTIGSCCLSEYKTMYTKADFKALFPSVKDISLDKSIYGATNADEYIRKSYKGGWCYVVKGKENQVFTNGLTLDVNSLYPSVMSSGLYYPVGEPTFWTGNYIPDEALQPLHYYFIRIRTRFEIKKGYLPFIQIKSSYLYGGNECLTTSDVLNKKTGEYSRYLKGINGEIVDSKVVLTLTQTDWKLIQEHYNLFDCEILDGCYFQSHNSLFDLYIDKYKKIKMSSSGGKRELAKLYLNNLYGKLATSDDSSFKYAELRSDGSIGFVTIHEKNKKVVYIPCGSAITSYARNFTIRTAQKNFYGSNRSGFIYADTDSIHIDLPLEKIKGVELSNTEFNKWKLETQWDEGLFLRQKTYIEHVVKEGNNECNPYYNIKCAGMPEKSKNLFLNSMTQDYNPKDYNKEELEFLKTERTMNDFKRGLIIPSKLLPKRIKGGIILVPSSYEIR